MRNYVNSFKTGHGYYAIIISDNGRSRKTVYRTTYYLTPEMATADAKCWKAFHMNETKNVIESGTPVTYLSPWGPMTGVVDGNDYRGMTRIKLDVKTPFGKDTVLVPLNMIERR